MTRSDDCASGIHEFCSRCDCVCHDGETMTDYHKQELLVLADDWTDGQLENYIRAMEQRVTQTREWIKDLRALQKRRKKSDKVRNTGERSG